MPNNGTPATGPSVPPPPGVLPQAGGFYSKEAAAAAQQAQQAVMNAELEERAGRLERERLIRAEAERKRR